jgi:hypothetical protein
MPICLNCKHQFPFYQRKTDWSFFIEECWCGGYIIDRDLIQLIINSNKSLNETLSLIGLKSRLASDQERTMITYAIFSKLSKNEELMEYTLKHHEVDPINYLLNVIDFVLRKS